MDFNYTPEDEAFRTEVRAWLEANKKFAPPPSNIMADEGAGDWEARVNWHKKLNEGGWVAVNWPKEYGGRGATVMQRLIYREELEPARTQRADDRNGHQPARADADALGDRGAEEKSHPENS